jgi:hypothetical protein
LLSLFCVALSFSASAQSTTSAGDAKAASVTGDNTAAGNSEIEEVRRELREQQEEIKRMRAIVSEQSQLIDQLRQRVEQRAQPGAAVMVKTSDIPVSDTASGADASQQASNSKAQPSDTDVRLSRVEEQAKKTSETLTKQLGSITFSGDFRLRYESLYGQLNALPNGDNPAILGNELSSRQRFRIRVRLALRGHFGKDFDWGLRLTSGSFADSVSTNQTLTDFYNHKPFAMDQAFIAWTPERAPGLRLQGGKFDVPWLRTEMTIDNDLTVEGFSEAYSHDFKKQALKNLTFVAWQLPFLERNSAFVRNANGTVNLEQSHRAGRDLALYGAQLRARIEPSSKVGLTLSAADLYYSGTQFITPVQFFGNQIQLPVTFTIPASGTTPAQTITTQVSIPRDLLVAGNANLGVSIATNNAVNRDGRLASGFNLVDLIGRLDLTHNARFPVALLFNFVVNTQVHDVSIDGPGGAVIFLPNHEDKGYWGEIQVGRAKERGDLQFGYTFLRIGKDAVLTPFNFSDIQQPSDTRVHRLNFSYTADPHVVLSFISIINQRPNGLLGVFATTPTGSLNRPTTRLQFDTTFRF